MVTLRRLFADTLAAASPERTGALAPDHQPVSDDDSTRNAAGHASDRSFERSAFSGADVTRLAILAQCVP
jgi:hypothetical protein